MIDLTETDLLARLAAWVTAGALRPLDLALTRFIRQQGPETDAAVLLAVALTSERNGHGHVCLDLKAALDHPDELLTSPRDDGETPDVDAHADQRVDANAEEKQGEENSTETATEQQKGGKQ